MNELDRLQESWKVVKHDDCFQVVDATGRFILAVSHRQDLHTRAMLLCDSAHKS